MANDNGPDQSVTDAWNKTLEKFNSVMSASTSAMEANRKSNITAQVAHEKLIKELEKDLGMNRKQAEQVAKSLKLEKELTDQQQKSMDAEKERQALQKKIDEERVDGAKKVAKSLGDFAIGSVKAANSVYTSENAFAAVTPIVTLMGTSLAGAIEGIAKMTTGFSIAGFSFGGMAEGAAKLAGVAISLTTQAMNMALENAGKLVENYNQLSKVGVTFGGDIEKMRASAAAGGLALDTYTKFVTKNIESLSTFGGSTQHAADTVMKLTKATSDNNEKLLVMYGGFEALNEAAVGYVDLISKTGFDVSKNVNSLNAGAASYLINMKELSALTGQSADAIKKEQEARMKSASYQVALANMSAEEQTAAKNKVSMVTRMYGKEAGDLLEEMIAGQGTVISESGLQLQSMLGPIAQSIQDIYKVGYGEDAVARTADTMSNYADTIDKFTKENSKLMFLNYGAQDQVLQMMNSVISQSRQTLNRQRDLTSAQADLDAENKKPMTESAKSLEGVIKSLNQLKMDIDEKTIKSFGSMAEVTKNLIGVIDNLYKMLTPENMGEAMKKFTAAIKEATDALRGMSGGTNRPPDQNTYSQGSTEKGILGSISRGYHALNNRMNKSAYNAGLQPSSTSSGSVPYKNPSEGSAGGPASEQIANAISLLQQKYPDLKINGVDDAAHRDPSNPAYNPNSKHIGGRAADFNLPADATLADIQQIVAALKIKAELHKNAGGGGSHVHMEELAKGGITNGTSIAGEAGPEAVIPLPDGRTIPVRMDMTEMVTKLEEMVALLREQRDNSEKLLYATQ